VETIAKKMYWSLVDEYMKIGVKDSDIETKIELLRKFLEEFDVGKFRSETEGYMQRGVFSYLLLELDDLGNINAEIKIK